MQNPHLLKLAQNLFKHQSVILPAFNLSCVLIFKTNVDTDRGKLRIKKILGGHPLIQRWNIDLEDIDCVLRVESTHLGAGDIIQLMNLAGYDCEELV